MYHFVVYDYHAYSDNLMFSPQIKQNAQHHFVWSAVFRTIVTYIFLLDILITKRINTAGTDSSRSEYKHLHMMTVATVNTEWLY